MALLPFQLPFAELEVGHHLYWQIGDLYLHGQVFLSSWILIGVLLALVLVGTRGMQRDPIGLQNLLEFLWGFIRDLARDQIGEKHYRDWLPFIGTLFLFIFCISIPYCVRFITTGTLSSAFVAALCCGLAIMTRPTLQFFPLF